MAAIPRDTTRVAIHVDHEDPFVESIALDVWSEAGATEVVVAQRDLIRLAHHGIAWRVIDPDIDATARAERERLHAYRPGDDFFTEYHDLEETNAYLVKLAALAPDRVRLSRVGNSVEGRAIMALTIGNGEVPMLVNGTQHAREWIATAVTTCVADRLVRQYASDPKVKNFVDHTTLWVVPVVNPDGYQFSWNSNRYWRKNRRASHGVDLNRNYSVAWGGKGSSSRERAEDYRGPSAFSEPESQTLRDLVLGQGIKLHIDFHAFGQLVLYPWGYTNKKSDDDAWFRAIGDKLASALFAQHETRYTLMPSSELYLAAGTMTDWVYGQAHAASYTIELRPKRGGLGGFVLPPEQIKPTCDEAFAAVLELRKSK